MTSRRDEQVWRLTEHVVELRLMFNRDMPFLGDLVNVVPVFFEDCGTAMCSDAGRYGEVILDPEFMSGMSRGQVGVVWLHEIFHISFGYFSRVEGLDEKRFNRAHDYAINLIIDEFINSPCNDKLQLEWPTGTSAPLLDRKYLGLIGEEIYDRLPDDEPDDAKAKASGPDRPRDVGHGGGDGPGQDGAGGGSERPGGASGGDSDAGAGSGDPGRSGASGSDGGGASASGSSGDGESGSGGDGITGGRGQGGKGQNGPEGPTTPRGGGRGYTDHCDCVRSGKSREASEDQGERMQRLLHEALMLHGMRGAGDLPGGLQEVLKKLLKPKVGWFEDLLHVACGTLPGSGVSYQRLSRRSQTLGIAMPGKAKRKPRICSVWDTSGSIDILHAMNFAGALRQIGDVLEGDVRLIQIDVDVTSDVLIDDFDAFEFSDIAFSGRGGTNFDILPAYLENQFDHEIPDLVILFTDGMVDWCDYELWPCPVIVVTTELEAPAPYKTIKLELERQ